MASTNRLDRKVENCEKIDGLKKERSKWQRKVNKQKAVNQSIANNIQIIQKKHKKEVD